MQIFDLLSIQKNSIAKSFLKYDLLICRYFNPSFLDNGDNQPLFSCMRWANLSPLTSGRNFSIRDIKVIKNCKKSNLCHAMASKSHVRDGQHYCIMQWLTLNKQKRTTTLMNDRCILTSCWYHTKQNRLVKHV